MKDSLLLYNIYKRYLKVTSDLITILERHYGKINGNTSPTLKQKFIEFREHTHDLIEGLNTDLHKLLKIDTELKNIENAEKEN